MEMTFFFSFFFEMLFGISFDKGSLLPLTTGKAFAVILSKAK
jgi:hypothetical protein